VDVIRVLDGFLDDLGGPRGSGLDRLLDAGRRLLGSRLGGWGGSNLVATIFGDELGQVLNGAGAIVGNGLVLLASGVKLDGREALDVIWHVVGGGIDLGDGDLVRVGSEQLGQLLVLGSEGLAVSAPRGVEFEKNILLVVNDVLLVGGGNDNVDALLLLGNGLRLDGRVDLAFKEILDELADGLLGDLFVLVVGELGVLGGVLNGEGGPLANLEVEVASVLAEGLGVNGSKVDLALELLGDGLQFGGEFLALLLGLGEDVGKRNAGLRAVSFAFLSNHAQKSHLHVSSVRLWANFSNKRSGSGLDELGQFLGIKLLLEGVLALVEGLVEDHGGRSNASLLGERGIAGGTEEVAVAERIGNLGVCLVGGFVISGEVANEDDRIRLGEIVVCGLIKN
jgi:hypothetical protein